MLTGIVLIPFVACIRLRVQSYPQWSQGYDYSSASQAYPYQAYPESNYLNYDNPESGDQGYRSKRQVTWNAMKQPFHLGSKWFSDTRSLYKEHKQRHNPSDVTGQQPDHHRKRLLAMKWASRSGKAAKYSLKVVGPVMAIAAFR